MPAPVLQWWDSGDVAQATSLTFAPENGVATAAQTVHLWNDKGGTTGSDDATELHLTCYTRDQGDTTWSQTRLLYTSPSQRDRTRSRMPSSA